jgi:hypothetical protein
MWTLRQAATPEFVGGGLAAKSLAGPFTSLGCRDPGNRPLIKGKLLTTARNFPHEVAVSWTLSVA